MQLLAFFNFSPGDMIIIAKGATVTGTVVDTGGKKKFLGIGGGKVTFKLQQVDAVDGRKLNVRAAPGKRADMATRPFEIAGKKPPKELAAAEGSEYIAYVDGEQTVSIRK